MKTVTFLIITIILFTSCVDKNGFSNFNFTPQQEQWENNQVNSKIQDQEHTEGMITAVYLNKVMPDLYKGGEYFYLIVYLKDSRKRLSFTLNGQLSILEDELEENDRTLFQNFTKNSGKWNRYYIVGFSEQEDKDTLSLQAKSNVLSSEQMVFKKDE